MKRYICLVLSVMLIFLCACAKKQDTVQTAAQQTPYLPDDSVYANLGEDTLWLSVWGFDTFNPVSTKSDSVADCAFLVYDALFYLDENHRACPMLAQSYSVSDDGKRYTIKLNEDFKFHDGSRFTSADAVYTINEIKRLGANSLFYEYVSGIESAVSADDFTLIVSLYSPESLFINKLTFPIVKNGTPSDGSITEPIGTGPYKFVKSNLVRASYFEANEEYALGKPKIKNAVVNFIPERETQTYALEARQSDAACVTSGELENYNPKGGVKTVQYNNRHLTFLGINSMKDFLSYSAVRKSISLCADREDIVNTVLFGNGEQAFLPFAKESYIYPEKYRGLKKNQSEAVKLLEETGFMAGADGIRVLEKDENTKITASMSILVNSDNAIRTETAYKVCESLKQVGIDARVEQVDFETYKKRIETGNYDVFIGEVQMDLACITSPLAGSSARYSIYSSERLDKANEKIKTARGEEEIKAAFEELSDCLTDEMPIVCLYFGRDAMIAGSELKFGDYAVSGNEFSNLHKWEK